MVLYYPHPHDHPNDDRTSSPLPSTARPCAWCPKRRVWAYEDVAHTLGETGAGTPLPPFVYTTQPNPLAFILYPLFVYATHPLDILLSPICIYPLPLSSPNFAYVASLSPSFLSFLLLLSLTSHACLWRQCGGDVWRHRLCAQRDQGHRGGATGGTQRTLTRVGRDAGGKYIARIRERRARSSWCLLTRNYHHYHHHQQQQQHSFLVLRREDKYLCSSEGALLTFFSRTQWQNVYTTIPYIYCIFFYLVK